jgi:hypothetical protein
MLTIREEQMSVLRMAAYDFYVDRMVRQIAVDYPAQFHRMGADAAREFVIRAIQNGSRNHVETEGGVAILIQLMIEFGERFENSPDKAWALDMLSHSTMPAQLKLKLMRERMTMLSQGRVVVPFQG